MKKTQNKKLEEQKCPYFLAKIIFWPLFRGPKFPGSEASEPQKGVKNQLFDQNKGTFTNKKKFLEQLLLNRIFSKTFFSGTYSNKLDHFLGF